MTIRIILNLIKIVLLGTIAMPIDYMIGLVLLAVGKATIYSGLKTIDGERLTYKSFLKKVWGAGRESIILTDQGPMVFCHGVPGGYISSQGTISEKDFIDLLPEGKYEVVSCYGGTRSKEITNGTTSLIRSIGCDSPYCSLSLAWGNNALLVFSSNIATALAMFILGNNKLAYLALFGTEEEWIKESTVPLKEKRTRIPLEELSKNLVWHSVDEI